MKRLALALQVFLLCMWGMAAPPASAQSVDTGILGTVVDSSGAVVPGAEITVTGVSTGVVQTASADRTGPSKSATSCPATTWSRPPLQGFRTERRAITLRVGQLARLNFVPPGRQHRRGGRRRSPGTAARDAERRHRQRRHRGNDRQPAAQRPQLHDAGKPDGGRGRVGRELPRERRAQHVPAGLLRRRERAQQPRQQPVHVPLGRRGRGVQGAGDELHRRVRRTRRRQRAAAAQVRQQQLRTARCSNTCATTRWMRAITSRRRPHPSRSWIGISSEASSAARSAATRPSSCSPTKGVRETRETVALRPTC